MRRPDGSATPFLYNFRPEGTRPSSSSRLDLWFIHARIRWITVLQAVQIKRSAGASLKDEVFDSPSIQADLALGEIDRLHKIGRSGPDARGMRPPLEDTTKILSEARRQPHGRRNKRPWMPGTAPPSAAFIHRRRSYRGAFACNARS